jgi:hypothetical protein
LLTTSRTFASSGSPEPGPGRSEITRPRFDLLRETARDRADRAAGRDQHELGTLEQPAADVAVELGQDWSADAEALAIFPSGWSASA